MKKTNKQQQLFSLFNLKKSKKTYLHPNSQNLDVFALLSCFKYSAPLKKITRIFYLFVNNDNNLIFMNLSARMS